MVYLPPDLVTNILSLECGTSVRAMIMIFFEIPLLMRIRSPSRMVTRLSRLRRWLMQQNYHRATLLANYLVSRVCPLFGFRTAGESKLHRKSPSFDNAPCLRYL